MIEVKNIDKSFDGVQVLKNVSAVFENGKTNMIIGASGSGKTVLMKSIIGLHRIDKGKIEYDGRNLPDMRMSDIRLLRREVGMLFQGSALFDSLSVLENVMYPLEMFANTTRDDRKTVEESLNRTTNNSSKENQALYSDFEAQMKSNPERLRRGLTKLER
jgi:phospholipid/cholesterol/gamma-HCH transport system ATP-binding protein